MRKFKFIVVATALAGAVIVLWVQRSRNENLRRENEVLRRAIAELKDSAGNDRLISTDKSLIKEQLEELLKLRGEVTRLREQTNQIGALILENQKLTTSLRSSTASKSKEEKHPQDALPQDIHPKGSWAFRGYASPEATVETLFWAEVNGDKAAMLGAFSSELQPELEKAFEQRNLPEEWSKTKVTGFRIVDRKELSADEIVLTVYTDRQYDDGQIRFNAFNPTVLKRIGGEWQIKHAPRD